MIRLETDAYEKIWGTAHTGPWHANPAGIAIGEVWFRTREVKLLIKFLFTAEKLSVQVHPGDEYALEHEKSLGKTEMWHVLRSTREAQIAGGLKRAVTRDELLAASGSEAIVDLLKWMAVSEGQSFFIEAGTVHAIGEDLVLCEVQQQSDITYRLYDYDRPRELQIADGVAVSNLEPNEVVCAPVNVEPGCDRLVACDYFSVEKLTVKGSMQVSASTVPRAWIVLSGEGTIAGEPFRTGEGFESTAHEGPVEIVSESAEVLLASVPVTLE